MPAFLYRIEELETKLKEKCAVELALDEQARQQELTMMELEASLSQVKEALVQKQLEVRQVAFPYSFLACSLPEVKDNNTIIIIT